MMMTTAVPTGMQEDVLKEVPALTMQDGAANFSVTNAAWIEEPPPTTALLTVNSTTASAASAADPGDRCSNRESEIVDSLPSPSSTLPLPLPRAPLPSTVALPFKSLSDLFAGRPTDWRTLAKEFVDQYHSLFPLGENASSASGRRGDASASASATSTRARAGTRYYKVSKAKSEVYAIVTLALESDSTWQEVASDADSWWSLFWSWARPHVHRRMFVFQRVHRFPNTHALTRKDELSRNLARYSRLPGRTGDAFRTVMPETYDLPAEYGAFCCSSQSGDAVGEGNAAPGACGMWILKPAGKSRGRGIRLISRVEEVAYGEASVIQRYISNPFLIDGTKFDLRLYVLVTAWQPELTAYIYTDGFGRFAMKKYSFDGRGDDLGVHLTNASLARKEGCFSSKWRLHEVFDALPEERSVLWFRIVDVVLRSLVAVEDVMDPHECCFELFGYDILLDASLKPWLLEVNASPMMQLDTAVDEEVKIPLIEDTIRVVAGPSFDRQELYGLLRRRLTLPEGKGAGAASTGSLAEDLGRVFPDGYWTLQDPVPPAKLGGYEPIAPSESYQRLRKLKRLCQ